MTGLEVMLLMQALASAGQAVGKFAQSRKSDYDRITEDRLADLTGKANRGELGLTDDEAGLMQREYLSPLAAMNASARLNDEALLAARGDTTGVGLDLARQQSAQRMGAGIAEAVGNIQAADIARRQEQTEEMRGLEALVEQRRVDRRNMRTEAAMDLAGLAGQVGMAAAMPPGTFKLAGAFGVSTAMNMAGQLRAMRRAGTLSEADYATLMADPRRALLFLQNQQQMTPMYDKALDAEMAFDVDQAAMAAEGAAYPTV